AHAVPRRLHELRTRKPCPRPRPRHHHAVPGLLDRLCVDGEEPVAPNGRGGPTGTPPGKEPFPGGAPFLRTPKPPSGTGPGGEVGGGGCGVRSVRTSSRSRPASAKETSRCRCWRERRCFCPRKTQNPLRLLGGPLRPSCCGRPPPGRYPSLPIARRSLQRKL